MTSNHDMVETFGIDSLVYAQSKNIHELLIPAETKEFVLNTGFPFIINWFRFSLEFTPVLQDIQLGKYPNELKSLMYIIGVKSACPTIGAITQLSEIGLNNNSSLPQIWDKIVAIEEEEGFEDYIFKYYVTQSHRICLDASNDGQIVSVNPNDLSITFVNSNIQKLAASLVAFGDLQSEIPFEDTLNLIDSKAQESEENLWAQIINQPEVEF